LSILFSRPVGRVMVGVAAILMTIGIMVIKKMVKIKV
jgi:Flp pilus assembly protein TadB